LGEEIKVLDTALPAISLENRDRIRGGELPILGIPRIKDFRIS